MKIPNKKQATSYIVKTLAEIHGVPEENVKILSIPDTIKADAILHFEFFTFLIEWKGTTTAAQIAQAANRTKKYASQMGPNIIPLVAVPYMGEVGKEQCDKAGVSWMDISGNALIVTEHIRTSSLGFSNKFKRRGRPSSVFAPKSSRIARWLLIHPDKFFSQREIALATQMDEGHTSRIVRRLEKDGFLKRNETGFIRAKDPNLLLDAWRENYDFSSDYISRGHVPARSGVELQRRVAKVLQNEKIKHAATGLGAAWLYTHFAGFRIATFYIQSSRNVEELLFEIGFRHEERGANLWLVLPDDGVFQNAKTIDGVQAVHPVQVYLDLAGHPERAKEAEVKLRQECLDW